MGSLQSYHNPQECTNFFNSDYIPWTTTPHSATMTRSWPNTVDASVTIRWGAAWGTGLSLRLVRYRPSRFCQALTSMQYSGLVERAQVWQPPIVTATSQSHFRPTWARWDITAFRNSSSAATSSHSPVLLAHAHIGHPLVCTPHGILPSTLHFPPHFPCYPCKFPPLDAISLQDIT